MHYIFITKQKTRFRNFENIAYWYRLSVHEWPIYQYQPPKSYIGQSLMCITEYGIL